MPYAASIPRGGLLGPGKSIRCAAADIPYRLLCEAELHFGRRHEGGGEHLFGTGPEYFVFAAGICSLAVAFTILSVWYQNPRDRFLFWGCLGMILLGAGAVLYYAGPFSLETASIVAFGLETAGFLFLYVGARQISGRVVPGGLLTAFAIIVVCAVALPVLGGWAGIGTAVFNIAVAALLVMTAREYIHVLREAPIPVAGMIVLYVLTALSFFLCGAVIIHERQWVLTDIPVNWAEDLNAITAIIGITGIGALSLSFTQSRIARRHANDARTDSLTGLLNRRALYDLLSKDELRRRFRRRLRSRRVQVDQRYAWPYGW